MCTAVTAGPADSDVTCAVVARSSASCATAGRAGASTLQQAGCCSATSSVRDGMGGRLKCSTSGVSGPAGSGRVKIMMQLPASRSAL